ncbi:MAG: sodium:solute symporter [Luteimonas sp.]|nr:sodium:solute symporter [Luteimonas sp.]
MRRLIARGRKVVSTSARAGLHALACLVLYAGFSASATAEGLVSAEQRTLPSLPGDARGTLDIIGDRPVVAGADGAAWVLAGDGASWKAAVVPALDGRQVLATAAAGARSWRLLGTDAELTAIQSLQWQQDALQVSDLVPPPATLREARAAVLADTLYLAGLGEDGRAQVWAMPVAGTAPRQWRRHDGWPGDAAPASLVAQKFALYLSTAAGELWQWTQADGWVPRGRVPDGATAVDAKPIGQAHVLYLLASPGGALPRLFHTITGSWADWPGDALPASVAPRAWRNGLAWRGGDGVVEQQLQSGKHLLNWPDWLVIGIYLASMLGIGAYFYFREKRGNTSDFFVGGRSIPFWAAGISLYATNTSSISFIAIPAKAFETNWQYLTNNLIAVVGLMFVAVWIVPLLRRLDLMSVFSYLETRFHPAIRMLASALCIVMQIGSRMSVILFLPALAISTITGLDVIWSVLIMGVFTIVYTTMGGMKAVIWTDFVQVFVMFGGALFAIGFILQQIDGGVPAFVSQALAENKTKLFDFSFDLTKATVWGFIFLVVFDVVLTFPKDQVLMQRVLSTKSDKEAGRSIWTFAAIMIPGGFVFYGIGTALWSYYKSHPERLDPLLPIDATFPLFIAAELPMGVTGLIIAGIFAAAMSTLSSIINSVSTLASVDFYEKLKKDATPEQSVRFAEWIGVAVGVIAICIALVMSRYDIHSLFDVSIELAGLLGGGFAGAYTLGMFTRRANSKGVAIGVAGSIVITLVCWSFDLVHPYFYLGISIMLCIVIGYLASLCFPPPAQSLEGLTIHARDAKDDAVGAAASG